MKQIDENLNKANTYATKNKESLFSIILILVGLSFILNDQFFFNLIWEVAIIIWGIFNLRVKNYFYGFLLIVIGGLFIMDIVLKMDIKDILIGFFLIVLGSKVLFENLR